MSESRTTTDHRTIKNWVEDRGGHPASITRTQSDGEPGVLRIDFGEPEEGFEQIDWDAFFEKFDGENLAFLYQDKTNDGQTSRFCKFIDRDSENAN